MITMQKHARDGFSLIEIMIAITILAIVAVAVGPMLFRQIDKARAARARTDLVAIRSAIDQYNLDTSQYPSTLRDLVVRPADETASRKWDGPYLKGKDAPKDPWGRKFIYEVTEGEEHPYKLLSYGSKGKGAKEAEWISVWDEE